MTTSTITADPNTVLEISVAPDRGVTAWLTSGGRHYPFESAMAALDAVDDGLEYAEGPELYHHHATSDEFTWDDEDRALPPCACATETPTACHKCGCTDDHACVTDAGPCSWVASDPPTCSACH